MLTYKLQFSWMIYWTIISLLLCCHFLLSIFESYSPDISSLLAATPSVISHLWGHPLSLHGYISCHLPFSSVGSNPTFSSLSSSSSHLVFGVMCYMAMMGGQTVLVRREARFDKDSGTVIISISGLFIFPVCDLRWLLAMETGLCGPQNTGPANPPVYPQAWPAGPAWAGSLLGRYVCGWWWWWWW